jgi:hypothetical protein
VSGREVRTLARTLGEVQPRLAALRDEVERAMPSDVAERARSMLDALVAARDALDALAEGGLAESDDPVSVARAVECARAAIELGPACRALTDICGTLAEQPPAVQSRVAALHLAIAHRQCVAAMHALERSHP